MKNIVVMLKPASSLCNLRCRYCFYANVSELREVKSFGVMKKEVYTKILENIFVDLDEGDRIVFAFQGGEPCVAGLDFFKNFIDEVDKYKDKKVNVGYSLQTNGTLIDDEWADYLKEHDFLVGISLDGYEELNDLNRVDDKGVGCYKDVMKTIEIFNEKKIEYNVLMTLTSMMAKEPKRVYQFIKDKDLKYIQFTPCLSDFNEKTVYGLDPEDFYKFYKEILGLWFDDFISNGYRSIKLFDDVINLFTGNGANACGITGKCPVQIVVEASGDTYPCDFYMLDEYKTGNLTIDTIKEVYESDAGYHFRVFQNERHLCKGCMYEKVCNGGCKRMRENICYRETDEICYYRLFLDDIREIINKLMK